MKEIIDKIREAYDSENIENISLYSKYFAKIITLDIMEKNYDDLKELYVESAKLRQSLDRGDRGLKRDKNYYMGYIYAYENIARRLGKEANDNIKIEQVIAEDSKAIKIIKFLDKKSFASHQEIATYLDISISNLSNFFKKKSIIESNVFGSNKIGTTKFYYLTSRGKEFYLSACNKENKMYSEEDIIELIDLIRCKDKLLDEESLQRNITIFSDRLLKEINNFYLECVRERNLSVIRNRQFEKQYIEENSNDNVKVDINVSYDLKRELDVENDEIPA
jgi:hypothetical protein